MKVLAIAVCGLALVSSSCATMLTDSNKTFTASTNDLLNMYKVALFFKNPTTGKRTHQQYKTPIEKNLVDPESSRYRNIKFYSPRLNGKKITVMCGRHNSKNKMGGYTGYKWFVSDGIHSDNSDHMHRKTTAINCLCRNGEISRQCQPTKIYLNNQYLGDGSATARMRPYGTDIIIGKKPGCSDAKQRLNKVTYWGWFLFGNCLLTYCVGILIDLATGAHRGLDQTQYDVTPHCG